MRLKEIHLKDGVIEVKTDANEKQWAKVLKWIEESTDGTKINVARELRNLVAIKVVILP